MVARRLHGPGDGRLVGEVLLLELDGAEIFDDAGARRLVEGAVGALGDGAGEAVRSAGDPSFARQDRRAPWWAIAKATSSCWSAAPWRTTSVSSWNGSCKR